MHFPDDDDTRECFPRGRVGGAGATSSARQIMTPTKCTPSTVFGIDKQKQPELMSENANFNKLILPEREKVGRGKNVQQISRKRDKNLLNLNFIGLFIYFRQFRVYRRVIGVVHKMTV